MVPSYYVLAFSASITMIPRGPIKLPRISLALPVLVADTSGIEAAIEIYLEIAQAPSSFGGPHRVLRGVVSCRVFEALLGVEEMDLALRVDVRLRMCRYRIISNASSYLFAFMK